MFCTPLVGLSGAFKHGERQAYGVRLYLEAIAEERLSQKQAASVQGLSEPQWSRQCQLVDGSHMSYPRMWEMPAGVLKRLAMKVLADFDIVCIEQAELKEIVLTNRQIVAAVQARQQVAMSLPAVEESERRSA